MSRPFVRRAPKRNGGFSWGRYPMGDTGVIAYRLFRRDLGGALHFEGLNFYSQDSRSDVAIALRAACHRLRDRVDALDLASLGVAA
ncbi:MULTISPECIES: hypothetical protein [Stenotrophomonas]|uniref:hypothetical protein n=1 Tax=Stenotrophomonas TaxID=40323 RepID=UPI0008727045|nr:MULTISPECIES: hypothetical protein [Stenotrophomonas]OEZ02280.1 hypothetical protein BIY45_01765 [Stenotrophomonas sp. BIIR7]